MLLTIPLSRSRYLIGTTFLKRSIASIALHSFIEIPQRDVTFYNRTINRFLKSGHLNSARQMFDEMPERDVISWNLMITGYARQGFAEQALKFYKLMNSDGTNGSPSTFSSILGICSNGAFHRKGLQIHCRVIVLGFESNLFVGSALVNLYMQCSCCDDAEKIFDSLSERSLPTWNSILHGYELCGRAEKLLAMFLEMRSEGVDPNEVSFSYIVRGCGNGGLFDEGKEMHCHVIKLGLICSNIFISNAFVDFYSMCGSLTEAEKSIESIRNEDLISWNSIVSVYARHGFVIRALEFFYQMQVYGKRPSIYSFIAFLNLCSRFREFDFGKQIHGQITKLGFDSSFHVRSALIYMYGECGGIHDSFQVFDEMPERNLECCNALITSFSHCGAMESAVEIFELMVNKGEKPDHITFSAILNASSSLATASLTNCELLHACVIKSGFESEIAVSTSLINAYSKSGKYEISRTIFNQIAAPTAICFTAMISAYARNGLGTEGLQLFEMMIERDLRPDSITFLSVLNGCDHSGLVQEGRFLFESMRKTHGLNPDRRHHSSMINLLGRAGLLTEAEELLKFSPFSSDSVFWSSLLGSCKNHENAKVGKRAAKALLELEGENPTALLQAFGFFCSIGDLESSERVRKMMGEKEMERETGYSLIEAKS